MVHQGCLRLGHVCEQEAAAKAGVAGVVRVPKLWRNAPVHDSRAFSAHRVAGDVLTLGTADAKWYKFVFSPDIRGAVVASAGGASSSGSHSPPTCPECLQVFVHPVVLPCSHIFCWPCAVQLLTGGGGHVGGSKRPRADCARCPCCSTQWVPSHVEVGGEGTGADISPAALTTPSAPTLQAIQAFTRAAGPSAATAYAQRVAAAERSMPPEHPCRPPQPAQALMRFLQRVCPPPAPQSSAPPHSAAVGGGGLAALTPAATANATGGGRAVPSRGAAISMEAAQRPSKSPRIEAPSAASLHGGVRQSAGPVDSGDECSDVSSQHSASQRSADVE